METKRFGTFEGVFTPTVLSILGVVMYLRLGWVVGQAGLFQALGIIMISNLITLCTGLSVASITTNIRIGTGGAYSIIAKSLGLEAAGAIGIPLYLSQAVSVAFYVTGFTECWVAVFPRHAFILVSLATWLMLLLVSYLSAKVAFRIQFLIMGVIALSLVSVFLGTREPSGNPVLWHGTGQSGFWRVFAIFFPAVTGILAGVNMSGELKNPERSIPVGMLSAIVVTFVTYVGLALWFARVASAGELVNNTSLIIDLGRWRSLVIAGIMGATLSSGLSMFVASPRILLALAKHRAIPLSLPFQYVNPKGEPTTAILLTALISLATIALGTLNTIAGILTIFFLITYGTLNITVFVEKITGIVSFRPTFKIPVVVSLIGGAGCLYAMLLINQLFSFVAIAVTIFIYAMLVRSHMQRSLPDIRKGLFVFFAEQATKIAERFPYHPKIWKPNLLVPVEEPRSWLGMVEFIKAIASPRGRAEFFTIVEKGADAAADSREKSLEKFAALTAPLKEEGIFVSALAVESPGFVEGATAVTQALMGLALPPNVLFIKLGLDAAKDRMVKEYLSRTSPLSLGLMLFVLHPKIAFGQKQTINLWVRKGSPNIHLAILVSLQLVGNWEGRLRIVQAIGNGDERKDAETYVGKLKKIMRLPVDSAVVVMVGSFDEAIANAPAADMNIFGLPQEYDISWMRKISDKIGTSTLFLKDSNQEDAIV